MYGAGPLNPFGEDFLRHGKNWTFELCQSDSDNDGRRNGEELGDPWCEWTPGSGGNLSPPRSHPGMEPERDDPSLFVVRTLRRVMRPNFTCPGLAGPNTYTWMLRLPRVQIPTRFQSGVCMVFDLPANGDFHLIGGTPVIDNRDAVQQMFVYGCDEDTTVPVTLRPYACDGMPRRECQNIIGGYAGSIPGICFPRSGGIRIGRTGFKQIILQVRWTNLFGRFGTTDSSGMAMYYTNTLRQYDIGTKVLRATHFTIPPGQPAHTVTSTCPGECTVMQIRSPIYISMAFNHMHLLGRREKVELVRNGEVVSLITDEDAFSYDDPKAYW
ncbi:Dopamine beta-hydroxylase [Mizuhopecten yessoensis]|uniref:Dopamine beta-hydroxylase n=1 Tax=Mizuhopecten yessoensis TaxID=6573 RepID=A0A210QRF3_MIZYE|nr:Dopamine beta-hydroxylase [Mizuhopecten yessoensis]